MAWGPEKGLSGHKVFRYKLERDDPEPAPWSYEGQKNIVAYPKHFNDLVAEVGVSFFLVQIDGI